MHFPATPFQCISYPGGAGAVSAALVPGGVVVFHVSNRYIDLEPVVAGIAKDAGMYSVSVHRMGMNRMGFTFRIGLLVTTNQEFLASAGDFEHGRFPTPLRARGTGCGRTITAACFRCLNGKTTEEASLLGRFFTTNRKCPVSGPILARCGNSLLSNWRFSGANGTFAAAFVNSHISPKMGEKWARLAVRGKEWSRPG